MHDCRSRQTALESKRLQHFMGKPSRMRYRSRIQDRCMSAGCATEEGLSISSGHENCNPITAFFVCAFSLVILCHCKAKKTVGPRAVQCIWQSMPSTLCAAPAKALIHCLRLGVDGACLPRHILHFEGEVMMCAHDVQLFMLLMQFAVTNMVWNFLPATCCCIHKKIVKKHTYQAKQDRTPGSSC